LIECDVAIIGGGPGGYVCAIRAAQLKLRTVLVEMDKVGGECLNYGCIPSKSLITVAKLVDRVSHAERMGLRSGGMTVDFAAMRKWKSEVVSKLVGGVETLLKGNGAAVVRGSARFLSSGRLEVSTGSGTEEITAKNVVIATGTSPIQLPGIEYDGSLVISSREALEPESAPKRLLVVGGGAIGLEFAFMYQKLGSSVTVVELMDQLLPGTDPDAVRVVQRKLEGGGAKVYLKSKVASLSKSGGLAKVQIEAPDGPLTLEFDKVLQSVGRRPRTASLGLDAAGVKTDQRGFVPTDDRMMTNVQGVYAIGDVRGPPLLAHKASKEGIVAAEAISGLPTAADWKTVPDAVFTDPEIASAGLSESKAAASGRQVKVSRFQFAALGRALSTGETEGFVKLVYDPVSRILLGGQIVGSDASNMISEISLAIEMGATVDDLALTMHPHPTLPEAVMEASEAAAGKPVHQLRS
jgi:dihydrolipoyl dehydrogenase